MKLSAKDQSEYFSAARALSPMLGAPFQNPVDLTTEDIQRELAATYKVIADRKELHQDYIWMLIELHLKKFKPCPKLRKKPT